MRKNLLIATLVGLCVIGVTACSKGEESKPADESTPPATALTQPVTDQAPAQPTDTTAQADSSGQTVAAAGTDGTTTPSTDSMSTDNNTPTPSTDGSGDTTTPSTDTTATPATPSE